MIKLNLNTYLRFHSAHMPLNVTECALPTTVPITFTVHMHDRGGVVLFSDTWSQ